MKSRASLGQATGSRLGETVIREPCETRGFLLKRAATRLSENTPRPKRASSPELHMQHIPQAPTRPRLGEPSSLRRASLAWARWCLAQTKTLRLRESLSASLGLTNLWNNSFNIFFYTILISVSTILSNVYC